MSGASADPGLVRVCPQWDETKERFEAWWAGSSIGRPMMWLCGVRDGAGTAPRAADPFTAHADPDFADELARYRLRTRVYLAEAFPQTTVRLAVGVLALYLGAEPEFLPDSVWHTEFVESWRDTPPLSIDPENRWWKHHLAAIERLASLAAGGPASSPARSGVEVVALPRKSPPHCSHCRSFAGRFDMS